MAALTVRTPREQRIRGNRAQAPARLGAELRVTGGRGGDDMTEEARRNTSVAAGSGERVAPG